MDEARKIRFLYPPTIFVVALALAGKLDPKWPLREYVDWFAKGDYARSLGLAAVALLVLLTLGFTIGTLSVAVLRLLALIPCIPNYESALSSYRYDEVWKKLGGPDSADRTAGPYLTAAFDHGALDDGHKDWIDRRWNALNLSLHSGTALLLAILFTVLSSYRPGCAWFVGSTVLAILFFTVAGFARHDVRRMNDLLATARHRASDDNE